jgi:CSLREA domain-containing protein
LALCALVGGLVLALPGTYTVNDAGDAADATPGDGVCATASGVCTLRAAIQEANATSGAKTINFALPVCTATSAARPGKERFLPGSACVRRWPGGALKPLNWRSKQPDFRA